MWLLSCLFLLSHPEPFISGDFIYKVSSLSPTKHFVIHSRKALLNGISPAENRTIPPLKYGYLPSIVLKRSCFLVEVFQQRP